MLLLQKSTHSHKSIVTSLPSGLAWEGKALKAQKSGVGAFAGHVSSRIKAKWSRLRRWTPVRWHGDISPDVTDITEEDESDDGLTELDGIPQV